MQTRKKQYNKVTTRTTTYRKPSIIAITRTRHKRQTTTTSTALIPTPADDIKVDFTKILPLELLIIIILRYCFTYSNISILMNINRYFRMFFLSNEVLWSQLTDIDMRASNVILKLQHADIHLHQVYSININQNFQRNKEEEIPANNIIKFIQRCPRTSSLSLHDAKINLRTLAKSLQSFLMQNPLFRLPFLMSVDLRIEGYGSHKFMEKNVRHIIKLNKLFTALIGHSKFKIQPRPCHCDKEFIKEKVMKCECGTCETAIPKKGLQCLKNEGYGLCDCGSKYCDIICPDCVIRCQHCNVIHDLSCYTRNCRYDLDFCDAHGCTESVCSFKININNGTVSSKQEDVCFGKKGWKSCVECGNCYCRYHARSLMKNNGINRDVMCITCEEAYASFSETSSISSSSSSSTSTTTTTSSSSTSSAENL